MTGAENNFFSALRRERDSTYALVRVSPARYFRIRNHSAHVTYRHTVNPAPVVNFYSPRGNISDCCRGLSLISLLCVPFVLFPPPRRLFAGQIFTARSLTRFLASFSAMEWARSRRSSVLHSGNVNERCRASLASCRKIFNRQTSHRVPSFLSSRD